MAVALIIDPHGLAFLCSVLLIGSSVMIFSQDYMRGEPFTARFHSLVLIFVFSMLILIGSPNLLSLLLGWDGLGITSFLLVSYFQSSKAHNASLLTALTNRVGDVLLLISVACCAHGTRFHLVSWSAGVPEGLVAATLVGVACLTKRAQIPFSA